MLSAVPSQISKPKKEIERKKNQIILHESLCTFKCHKWQEGGIEVVFIITLYKSAMRSESYYIFCFSKYTQREGKRKKHTCVLS